DYDRPTWHRLGILPLRWFIPARLGEIVLHRWDIEAMTQPGTQLSEASVPYLVDYLLETLPYRYKQVAAPNVPTVFGFEIGSQRYLLVATPERLQIGGTSRADVTFKLSPEAAALLFSGRLPLMQAIAAKLIEVDGNAEQARDFADLIQTF